jgi:hypothetical protein
MKYTLKHAHKFVELFNIDSNVVSPTTIRYALNVELEHGTRSELTNISNDDFIITSKIVLAHLVEYPDYYIRLKKMEKQADAFWTNKNRNIFTE